ncbi:conserved Plasmodium protein, unknown function [Plasmodium gallinaceum]|uniref:Uncharacterized protein n=1 Tax=Plasmodium gallinaceum TaxID=5849 RepID=A0A1J1GN46_PLAGA|nr:conserved Plasmodium protein, unknown function [Plasmodium gallinaceum]CRG93796.1 conserved Plasmodium protein, unknown function [Plasmodium gallinaceum]
MFLFFYLNISHLFIASLCYQMIYIDSFEDNYDNELENISCSWRYFCDENFNFCEYGCSSKKKLKKGYNLLNTSSLHDKCFVNLECDNYDIFFDSENLIYFIYFSKIFFLINPDFTLYVNLMKRSNIKGNIGRVTLNENNLNEKNRQDKNKKILNIFQKINFYRNLVTKKFKKKLIKLLIFFILIHMIFFYLYIYTYLNLKKYDKKKQNN